MLLKPALSAVDLKPGEQNTSNRFSLFRIFDRSSNNNRRLGLPQRTRPKSFVCLEPSDPINSPTAAILPRRSNFDSLENPSRSNSIGETQVTPGSSPRPVSKRRTVVKRENGGSCKLEIVTKEVKALDFAMQRKNYVLVLLEVLPTLQSECMFRLAWALVDLRRVDAREEAKKRKVLLNQMNANFLQTGSPLEVEGLPPHLMVLGEDNAEQVLHFLLCELVKLPEILATLETDAFEDSEEIVSGEAIYYLEDFEELAEVIKDHELKKKLLRELMTSKAGGKLLVMVRCVAAIDQYESCVDKVEKKDLERMIRKIFFTKGTMFYIDSIRPGAKLEGAREKLLKELSMEEEVCAVLRNL